MFFAVTWKKIISTMNGSKEAGGGKDDSPSFTSIRWSMDKKEIIKVP